MDIFNSVVYFISQGDFGFPFTVIEFIYKNFYIWSFQSGAPNLDGIIRSPNRLLMTLVFYLFGNVVASYFYIILSVSLMVASFYIFLKYFLHLKNKAIIITIIICTVLSAAFLGNAAKIGLVAAASLLPLLLTLVKYFFLKNKIWYLIIALLVLNYSLLHPFTFAVNATVLSIYMIYKLVLGKSASRQYMKNLFISIFIGIVLNLYFILPLVAIGTIDKSALSQDTAVQQTDYSSIVDVANAGDSINALTMAKYAFIDFKYFDDSYRILFILGGVGILSLVLTLIFIYKDSLNIRDRNILWSSLVAFLVLVFLSSGNEIASLIIKSLVEIPGGWIFRSPLKWQLYAPIALMAVIAVLSKYVKKNNIKLLIALLIILTGIQSAYLLSDISKNLISLRKIETFQDLQTLPSGSRLLYLSSAGCSELLNDKKDINNEINQILNSSHMEVRRVSEGGFNQYRFEDFDYVFTCGDGASKVLNPNLVDEMSLYADGKIKLYSNKNPSDDVRTITQLYKISETSNMQSNVEYLKRLSKDYNFTSDNTSNYSQMTSLIEGIDKTNIIGNKIRISKGVNSDNVDIYSKEKLNFQNTPGIYSFSSESYNPEVTELKKYPIESTGDKEFEYISDKTITNIMDNGNFTKGPWTKDVEDCFNYDNKPKIKMSLVRENESYVKLSAANHIACTSKTINLNNESSMLLSFDYLTDGTNAAGYTVRFNDSNGSTVSFDLTKKTSWTSISQHIPVPDGASSASITVYSRPTSDSSQYVSASYRNFDVRLLPQALSEIYLIESKSDTYGESKVEKRSISPVQKDITLKKLDKRQTVIATGEAYSKDWSLKSKIDSNINISAKKIILNNNELGLVLDVNEYCTQSNDCEDDTIELMLYYEPQRLYIYGSILSATGLLTITFIYIFRKVRNR